ncbi:MAG: DUF309 domain-containing protein [Candidatus Rokubacteria bacterium]|nr:DUF309 domain-containing protein [Candidatus Rokubacteria bacterium]
MIPTLPVPLRNRLTDVILAALHDESARRELARLADPSAPTADWLSAEQEVHAASLRHRARRAAEVLGPRPLGPPRPALAETLAAAATLFDAGLHFEVHELLEPHWREARGAAREALQGLVQVAVGYQHLANRNLAGARALLAEGVERLAVGSLPGIALEPFASAVRASLAQLHAVERIPVPRFPRQGE